MICQGEQTSLSTLVTLGRGLDTVSLSSNHPIQNETAGSKTLFQSAKIKNVSPRLKIQKQRSTFRTFQSSMLLCAIL